MLSQPPPEPVEIVVYGERHLRGIMPERVLTQDDVLAYGFSTVGELIEELARQRGESIDSPVYLIDGRRVASLLEIDGFPVETIASIQIGPIGSALRAGGSARNRIINIALKAQTRVHAAEGARGFATDGGAGSRSADFSITDIRRPRRLSLAIERRSEQALRESDRGIVQPPDSPAGLGLARTLRPELDKIDLRLTGADQILPWLDGAISARLFETSTRAGLGLGAEGQPLRQAIRRKGGTLNLQLNAELDGWLVALSGQYSHERRSVLTDAASNALATAGRSRTAATTRIVDLDVDASRSVVELPAGPLNLSLRGRLSRESVAGQQLRFVQWIREVGLGLELPIASAAAGVLAPLGELSAGLELTRSQVSRLGAMSSATWSAQWQPADRLRIAGSVTAGQSPVGVDLLAAPVVETPGVRYTDPLTGETTDVTQVSGGNPGLRSQRTTARSLSVALRPMPSHPLLISMDYSATRSRDLVAALPTGSELLLLAFPDRFFRGPDGSLVRVDVRPVNFDSRSEDLLRTSVDLSLPLSGSGARIQFNLAHSWLLRSRLKLSDDQPETDLLSPAAIALGDVPRPRHQIDATLAFADRGLGISLYAQHRSASFLSIGTSASPNILRFAPLTRIDVRLFVTGDRLTSLPLLEGMRFTLGVTNLFNSRERVRDLSGQTPLAYQPAYRDSTGRTVLLEIRKVF